MLVASREIYKVNRKRKREYTPYDVSKEEVKEYQKRRSKTMDYEGSYDKDGKWSRRVWRRTQKYRENNEW